MSAFCPDPLWNQTLTWDTTDPHFTRCFQDTILAAVPTAALLTTLPGWYWLNRHRRKTQRVNWTEWVGKIRYSKLMKFKCGLSGLLILHTIFEFVRRWYTQPEIYPSDVTATALPMITYILTIFILIQDAKLLKPTSRSLTMYWALHSFVYIPSFRDEVINVSTEESGLCTNSVFLCLHFVKFQCFARRASNDRTLIIVPTCNSLVLVATPRRAF